MLNKLNRFTGVLMLLAATVGGLSACGSDKPKDIRVRGEIALAGQGELPDKATARVSLVEHTGSDGDNRIVAERTLHDINNLPISFNLSISPQLLNANGQYGLRAQILDKTDTVRWETPVPQRVVPAKQSRPTTLMLQSNDFHSVGPFETYRCQDDFRFELAHQADRVILRMGNRQISLTSNTSVRKQTEVYTNDHGDELAFGYNKTTLSIDGTTHMNCAAASSDTSSASAQSNDETQS